MIYPFLLTLLVSYTYCHVAKNNSDVYITYSGHAEANFDSKPILVPKSELTKSIPDFDSTTENFIKKNTQKQTDDVIFIPNSKEIKEERIFPRDNMKPIMNTETLNNILENRNIQFQTEPPTNKDVLFISGKNNENVEKETAKQKPKNTKRVKEIEDTKIILDCSKLDCNKSQKAVCGGKREHNMWKYRLFLNECFFRKVNCAFKYEENRYQLVSNDKCKKIGAHYPVRPDAFRPAPLQVMNFKKENKTRKSFISRRSLSMGIDGSFCSHPCPETCPDEYDPQCAMSSSGQKRVFMNHCKLDFNSCFYGVVWHLRPLAACVGGKKADMRQNRGFIGWMQRVGIVDKRGRLVLS